MSQINIQGGRSENLVHHTRFKMGVLVITLAADLVLTNMHPVVISINNGGAVRNVDMPAVASNEGMVFIIHNAAGGANTVTVRQPAAGATIEALAQGAMAIVYNNGATWLGAQAV